MSLSNYYINSLRIFEVQPKKFILYLPQLKYVVLSEKLQKIILNNYLTSSILSNFQEINS